MGGGHVSRPDFGINRPDPSHPLTEFYLLLQNALEHEKAFVMPALYAQFQAPARRIYPDEAAEYLRLSPTPCDGAELLLSQGNFQMLYSSIAVAPDGAPAALLLTEECKHTTCAVQLLPPFVWEDPLPPLPECTEAISITLTMRDVEAIDTAPTSLGHRLVCSAQHKSWLHHPKADTYLAKQVALFQRLWRR